MITSKKLRKYFIYCVGGIAGLLIITTSLLFLYKNEIVHYVFNKTNEKFIQKYNTRLSVESITINGLNEVHIKKLLIKPLEADTVFFTEELNVSIRLLPLLRGRIRPDKIAVDHARMKLIKTNGTDNYSVFFKSRNTQTEVSTERNYALVADRILDAVFGKIPRDLLVKDLTIVCQLENDIVHAIIPDIVINKHHINANIHLTEGKRKNSFSANGNIHESKRRFDLVLSKTDKNRVQLPFLESKLHAKTGFNQIELSFSQNEQSNTELKANGRIVLKGAYIQQAKISVEEIELNELEIDYSLTVQKHAIQLDSNSEVSINRFKTGLYGRYEKDTSRKISLGLHAPWFRAQNFFNAIPKGLCTSLKGIKTQGNLDYRLKFHADIDHPDSIEFVSIIQRDHFSVQSFGEANLSKINSDFSLPVYDNNKLVRTLDVSPQNPHFVPYDKVPHNVLFSVLTSEDGGFMHHRGFNQEAFKKSIAAIIKSNRFKRGGSTISMQLVKNVYLNKNKTISRKVEEVILVWLIENLRLTSKERMLEVYFNIIEWGPGVYGINEASAFYFNKKPEELKWNEAIYLASIVPSPKNFARKFDEQGNLKQMDGYYRLVANIMARRGQMPESVKDSLNANVKLTGPAHSYLKSSKDSTAVTSEEEETGLTEIR